MKRLWSNGVPQASATTAAKPSPIHVHKRKRRRRMRSAPEPISLTWSGRRARLPQRKDRTRDLGEAGASLLCRNVARWNAHSRSIAAKGADVRDAERRLERGEAGCVICAVADEGEAMKGASGVFAESLADETEHTRRFVVALERRMEVYGGA